MDNKLQAFVTKLTEMGFGKGRTTQEACKKLKKADLVEIIAQQHDILHHLNLRIQDATKFTKCIEMPAFEKAKMLFNKKHGISITA